MYDTIYFKLDLGDCGNEDFLRVAAKYLDPETILDAKGMYGEFISGGLGGLRFTATKTQIKLKEGSLCKWYLGDNYQTMERGDVKRAFESLGDSLHLPVHKAQIKRLDIGTNLIMKYPMSVYVGKLGELPYASRLVQPHSLYYEGVNETLCIYDKNSLVQKALIPELYKHRNVLRYEQRYLKRLPQQLGVPNVIGEMLYEEAFYIKLVERWLYRYNCISKINDLKLNFSAMKGVKGLRQIGLLALVNEIGGELKMFEQIKEAQQRGEIDKKQAMDMRNAIKEALKIDGNMVVKNDAMTELTRKVVEAAKYYR